ncbi:MAG TPA: SIS domain-containing protein, partial [Fimbriimonas sp.]|nr:SIS domain-containing protein [Fimbriimonas sp.]
ESLDFKNSIVVGDKASDVGLGKALGAKTCLVRTGYGAETETKAEIKADYVIDSLADLATQFLPDKPDSTHICQRRNDHFDQIKRIVDGFVSDCADDIGAAAHLLADGFRNGNKLLLCGNGGSAADAQHLATEFVARLSADRERVALPAIALTTDTSFITAYTNDYSFDGVFDRQIQALGQEGDILFAISTSGNSVSIVRAAERAKENGLTVVGFTGKNDSKLSALSDVCIKVPCSRTMRVQECHLMAYHIIADLVEEMLFGEA